MIQTKPRKEQGVFNNFCARGPDGLFPTILEGTTCRGRHYTVEKPLFSSYVFVKMLRNKMIVDWNGYEEVVEVFEEQGKYTSEAGVCVQRPRTMQQGPVRSSLLIKTFPAGQRSPEGWWEGTWW